MLLDVAMVEWSPITRFAMGPSYFVLWGLDDMCLVAGAST